MLFMSDFSWEKAWDKTTSFLEKTWDKTKGVVKSIYGGTKDLIFSKDLPDPLEDPDAKEEAQSYLDEVPPNMVGYYEYLMGQYEILLNENKESVVKYQKKRDELEQIEKDIHDDKLEKLRVLPDSNEKIRAAKNNSKFFEDDSPFDKEHKQDEKDAGEEIKKIKLPDENPLIKDEFIGEELQDKVPKGGPINLKLYLTLVKSQLKILERKSNYLEEQFDRSKYWLEKSQDDEESEDEG